ncbi:unnamed protein product [Linum trigynum]|uniref:Uncharacterized protein n=1 Tax=Linum trigynum TaxID=586398 RepID=A0AAV2GPV1_9ROSI
MEDEMVGCRRAGELNEVMVRQRGMVGATGRGRRQQAKALAMSLLIGGGLLEPAGKGNDGGCWIWEVGMGRQGRAVEEMARRWWLRDLGGRQGVGRGGGDGKAMMDGGRH